MMFKKNWSWLVLLIFLSCAGKPPLVPRAIYNDKADARHDIAAAIENASGAKKNVVLIFGANW